MQQHVANLLRGKIIVGYALWNDLSGVFLSRVCNSATNVHGMSYAVLGVPHPAVATRDVALYQPFRNALQSTQMIGLQTLMWRLMRRRVQEGKHDSVRPP